MADSSFDIVSKFDKQEIANAVNTAAKEIATATTSRTSAPPSTSPARSSR